MIPPVAAVPHVCSRPRWWQRRTVLSLLGGYYRWTPQACRMLPGATDA